MTRSRERDRMDRAGHALDAATASARTGTDGESRLRDSHVSGRYRVAARHDASLVPALRPERDLRNRWGIYSARADRWMDVVFASEREALDAIRILQQRAQA